MALNQHSAAWCRHCISDSDDVLARVWADAGADASDRASADARADASAIAGPRWWPGWLGCAHTPLTLPKLQSGQAWGGVCLPDNNINLIIIYTWFCIISSAANIPAYTRLGRRTPWTPVPAITQIPDPAIPPKPASRFLRFLGACENAYFSTSFELVGLMAFSSEKGKGRATKSVEKCQTAGSFSIQKFLLQILGTLKLFFWASNWQKEV